MKTKIVIVETDNAVCPAGAKLEEAVSVTKALWNIAILSQLRAHADKKDNMTFEIESVEMTEN